MNSGGSRFWHFSWRNGLRCHGCASTAPHGSATLLLAALVILALSLLKAYSFFFTTLPDKHDAVLPVRLSTLTSIMAAVEFAVAFSMLFILRPLRAAQLCTGLGLSFIVYRYLYAASGQSLEPCACLGAIGRWDVIPAIYKGYITSAIAIWFFLIGIWNWLRVTNHPSIEAS